MTIYRAGTLLIPSGTTNDPNRRHLHVICNDTDEAGLNLIVSVTSYTSTLCDSTCILEPHEHVWLRHRSYIFYRKAQLVAADALSRGLDERLIVRQADMNMQTFLRVRNGLCLSIQTPRRIKVYLGCG
jgi:hypothetical protein